MENNIVEESKKLTWSPVLDTIFSAQLVKTKHAEEWCCEDRWPDSFVPAFTPTVTPYTHILVGGHIESIKKRE